MGSLGSTAPGPALAKEIRQRVAVVAVQLASSATCDPVGGDGSANGVELEPGGVQIGRWGQLVTRGAQHARLDELISKGGDHLATFHGGAPPPRRNLDDATGGERRRVVDRR